MASLNGSLLLFHQSVRVGLGGGVVLGFLGGGGVVLLDFLACVKLKAVYFLAKWDKRFTKMRKRNKSCYQDNASISRHSLLVHRNFFCVVVLVCLCWGNVRISFCATLLALPQN